MSGGDTLAERCGGCGQAVIVRGAAWSGRCSGCGSWRSTLEPAIASDALQGQIDTAAREVGLREIRDRNNARILDEISRFVPLEGARLLDVGCAHGWFLEAAEGRGVAAEGVEPERRLADETRAAGRRVRDGYFPDAVEPGERFDVISFNDVLEHIPDAEAAIAACAERLTDGGVLSVNIPSASGLGYRIATALTRLGLRGPYERFWQFGLPSPHVHYFDPDALQRMIERQGLRVRTALPLSAVQRRGLRQRLHCIRRPSPASIATFAGLWLLAPILNRPRNSDVILVLAQRSAD